MITATPMLILIIAILIFPAWNRARKLNAWFGWDYGYPIYTLVIWFMISGIGKTASMSNMVIEIFISYLIVIIIVYVRVFGLSKHKINARILSLVVLSISFLVPVIIRLLMPTLEE